MKIFYILLVIIFGFILNIVLYYISTPYREFMQGMKNNEKSMGVTDEYRIPTEEIKAYQNTQLGSNVGSGTVIDSNESFEKYKQGKLSTVAFEDLDEKNKDVVLGSSGQKIYDIFSGFSLTELKTHSSLMDVTSEYPDKYFEYYDLDLTLYIFPTKGYSEVKEIFDLVQEDDVYTVNEVDNFGDESFYINLVGIDDGYVRVIVSSNGVVFGLKILKNQYNNVKGILDQL